MREVVVVEAVRSAVGRRNGGFAAMHPADLLGEVLTELLARSGVDGAEVDQVVGGCVGQVGMQAMNVTRNAWLGAGLPLEVAATTVDSQCGSSQQATALAAGLVGSGMVDVAIGCGVEVMTRVPMGSTIPKDPYVGKPLSRAYRDRYEATSQFEGAERIATAWGITREQCDRFGKESQDRAARAWAEDRFAAQVHVVDAPDVGEDGKPSDTTHAVARDECLRETTLDALAALQPVARADGVHTAGTSSQIADGAGAVLLMTRERADALRLEPLAAIVGSCLVGSDPVLMLTGPIAATQRLLADHGLAIGDVDVVEINEAFASVVLAWERELGPDMERVNPNGGAIGLGHPLGGTGAILVTKAVHELQRADAEHALVTMCCGGGLGTGMLLRRAA